ncbi:MAG: RDD family protein [Treponema sp.]|nr:RDD family protein [Treponema sp.]
MKDFFYNQNDSTLPVETPEGIEFIVHPAGLPIRACAWAIDSFIQGFVIVVVAIAAGLLGWAIGYWFFLILVFLLDWFYHFAFDVFGRGQSPGKRFMGIRVVRGDGSTVNPGASFLRNLLRFADTFLFLYLIAFVCMLASPGWRRFGDWAADTLVVYTANARIPGRINSAVYRKAGIPWLSEVPKVSPSIHLDYEEKQALLMFARRYPLLGKARADEIAKIWAPKLKEGDPFEVSASDYILGIAHSLGA